MTLFRHCLLSALAAALLWPAGELRAAETAETILIRKALEKDRSGRRRGDAELVLSAYDEETFSSIDAGGSSDPRGWTVQHPSHQAVGTALASELRTRRYDISRTVVFINVWKDKAFATTVDSGAIIGADGQRQPFAENRLWTFRKADDEWLATGVITDLGDTADAPAAGTISADDVAAALEADARAWTDDDAGDILDGLREEVVFVDAHYSSNPAKWLIVLGDRDETEEWLDERLRHVDYTVERTVLHAVAQGDAAVAVSRDRLAAKYAAGTASSSLTAHTTWLLRRSGGTWQATWVWWKGKPYPAEATALR